MKIESLNLLAEMVFKQDQMVEEIKLVKSEVGGVKSEISGVKNEIIKLNLQTAENTRAIIKLADKIESIADLENRVSKIEKVVFK